MAFTIAILGAESTGKTTLARALYAALQQAGHRAALVDEYLREFCEQRGRTPLAQEQAGIAAEQTRRIAAARVAHDVVIADTTAIMIAVYSDYLFADRSLYPAAQQVQASIDLTLLTALDLPWHADEMRDGPHVREPVDAMVRAALDRAGTPYLRVAGHGPERLACALAIVRERAAGLRRCE